MAEALTNEAMGVAEGWRAWLQTAALSERVQILAECGAFSRALAEAEEIIDNAAKAIALGGVARALIKANRQIEAPNVLKAALKAARLAGRESVFGVLERGAITLASTDQGQRLTQVYEAMMAAEDWWGVGVKQ
jgi:hypothetical protein